jgi:hypothetical protein
MIIKKEITQIIKLDYYLSHFKQYFDFSCSINFIN